MTRPRSTARQRTVAGLLVIGALLPLLAPELAEYAILLWVGSIVLMGTALAIVLRDPRSGSTRTPGRRTPVE